MTPDVPIHIVARRNVQRDEWERVCRACSYATFFHTPIWADIFAQATGGRMVPAAETIQFSDNVTAVLPLVFSKYPGNILRVYWSMPANTFGGWVSADSLTPAHAQQLVAHLKNISNLVWRENPYDPLLGSITIGHTLDDFTQAIDLRQGFAAAKALSDYSHRRAVRTAIDNGVSVAEASNFEQWESYFALYRASRERWKENNLLHGRGYDMPLLKAIYESPADHRKLWLAQVNGAPVAGTLCFYWNRHVVSWSSAGNAGFFKKFRPNDLLIDHIVRNAADAGYDWYDCNPSAGLKGVIEFKEHSGAQKMRSRVLNNRSLLRRVAELARGIF